MKEHKYFISVGGGENQLCLVQAVLKNNIRVITIDRNPQASAFEFSDIKIVFPVDDYDYQEIVKQLYLYINLKDIVGVGTRSFGKATEAVCHLSEQFDFPYIKKSDYTLYFLDKEKLKNKLSEKNVRIIPSIDLSGDFLKKKFYNKINSNFNIVLKHRNGNSKKNIFLLKSKKDTDLLKNLNLYDYFAEEYLDVDEITVTGFVSKKKFHLISISDKIVTKEAPFLEKAHILPSKYDFLSGEVILNCQTIAFATNMINCPFVAEFKVNKHNELFFIEAVPEVGGEFLLEKLISYHYKYDYFHNLVMLLTGKKFRLPSREKVSKKLKSQIHFCIPPEKKIKIQKIGSFSKDKTENCFFEKILKEEKTIVSIQEGNSCRVKVIGLSTKKNITTEDFYHSIQDRFNENLQYTKQD